MSQEMLTIESILMIKGKKLTIPEFAERYALTDKTDEEILNYARQLIKKNMATLYTPHSQTADVVARIEKAIEEEEVVDAIHFEEENAIQQKRQQKIGDMDTLSIELIFTSNSKAIQAEQWINSLGIQETAIVIKKGVITLQVDNISPQEYAKIARRYQIQNGIDATVNIARKGVVGATDAINYTATELFAPTAKIVGEAGVNLGKGLIHTGVKVGASLVNNVAKASEETKYALATDTELIKAKHQIKGFKDRLVGFAKSKIGATGSVNGITIK